MYFVYKFCPSFGKYVKVGFTLVLFLMLLVFVGIVKKF